MQTAKPDSKAARHRLFTLFGDAVSAVSAEKAMPANLPYSKSGRTLIVAAGKAAAPMAQIAANRIEGDVDGIALFPYGHGLKSGTPAASLEFIEAGHPVPDAAGHAAAAKILGLISDLRRGDQLLLLLSGGASALLALPINGITLADKQKVTKGLLASGAAITEINCVRKHLSAIKGGRLAVAAAPAQVDTLIISDIPGDDLSMVGSGPTMVDTSTLRDARDIIARYKIDAGDAVLNALHNPLNETPTPAAPGLFGSQCHLIASAKDALKAAGTTAENWGYDVINLGDDLEGDAAALGLAHAALAQAPLSSGRRTIILSGGETTVTVTNPKGRGGRNLTYLLSLAIGLKGAAGVSAIAGDTDGIDGTGDNAGAVITPDTLARARLLKMDPAHYLATNDAYMFFEQLGDLVITGPTRTNANDFRAIMIDPILQHR